MAAALECWSARSSADEDSAELLVLMNPSPPSSSAAAAAASSPYPSPADLGGGGAAPPPKRWRRLRRNFAGAIATLVSSLTLDPSSSSPPTPPRSEKLASTLRRHFDSLPSSYALVGFEMNTVLLHARLVEQSWIEDQPAIHIEEFDDVGLAFTVTFACTSPISWPSISTDLQSSSISCKKVQIFEKNGLTLGIVIVLIQPISKMHFKSQIEVALKSAMKKPRTNGVKLPFGLCGCQDESLNHCEGDSRLDEDDRHVFDDGSLREGKLLSPLPESSLVVSIDEWQSIQSSGQEIARWVISSDEVEFIDRVGPSSFKGVYRGKKVWVKKLRGCERGTAYDIEIRHDLLQLMSCGHANILQFYGISFEENHGLCIVTKMMEGGSVHDVIQRNEKIPMREVVGIALDVAEGLMFVNDHGMAYRDLSTQRILLDRQGNACIGYAGVVTSCCNAGEVKEYEMAGYRWLAPEIIAGDPESVSETWMSNVYSFGMVLWEMVTGEAAYSSYSPVQAAVGIAACGLRPEIPKDCPQVLRSLMLECWNSSPSKRPKFSEIIDILQRQKY
ncbi:serine/threonine-protein kinase HT1-like [Ananas comosus]|uniref:Serine/threonine-protein kinase HT1-like n=1 Tax=Ananas comosus TaxID=4615 RepID=A0A6P5EWQ9_ANACO|nr:serine/threonine-protein kinase HT1-like [Ananas comosus]